MKIKYMGSSHVHQLLAGDDFGGRLSTPLKEDVEFNEGNRWVVDAKKVGLSDSAVEILLDDPDFLDVSDLEMIPVNKNQQIFKGLTDRDADDADLAEDASDSGYQAPVTSAAPSGSGTTEETSEAPSSKKGK